MSSLVLELELSCIDIVALCECTDAQLCHSPYMNIALSRRANPDSTITNVPLGSSLQSISFNKTVVVQGHHSMTDDLRWESLNLAIYCARRIVDEDEESLRPFGYSRAEPLCESLLFLNDLLLNGPGIIWFLDASDEAMLEKRDSHLKFLMHILKSDAELAHIKRTVPGYRAAFRIRVKSTTPAIRWKDVASLPKEKTTAQQLYVAMTGYGRKSDKEVAQLKSLVLGLASEEQYVKQIRDTMVPTEPGCRSIHVLYWPTVMGTMLGPAYSGYNCYVPMDKRYALYCLEIVVRAQFNITPAQLFDVALKQQQYLHLAIGTVCQAACLFSNACDYMSDLSRGQATERFLDAIETLGGDCEDLAQVISIVKQLTRS